MTESAQPMNAPATLESAGAEASVFEPMFAPSITATKQDTLFTDVDGDTKADPGDTLKYTVVITSGGPDPATAVTFTDTIDPNTTLVTGSIQTTPVARNDSFSAIGNVQISIPAPGVLANDSDADGDTLTASAGATSTNGGNVNVSSNGAFTYNPAPGFEGTDTFTYTINDGNGNTDTATVTITVSGMIWFIDDSAAAGGDGRLTTPFNALTGAGSFDAVAADDPGDNIFLFSGNYTGGLLLKNNQRLIGQGASDTLANITGLTPPTGSLALPATGGANPVITSGANGINLGQNNTIRGLTIGNTTGAGISGTGFGTLTVGPAALPSDTTINGTGQALSLTTGTLAARFTTVDSSNSSATGISLSSVGGNMSVGSSNIQNPSGAGISIATSAVNFNVTGTTTVNGSGGTGLGLSGSSGNMTFAALNITPDSGQRGFHATTHTGTITTTSGVITTSGATAVEVVGTAPGTRTPLALNLTTVSAGTSAPNGILLTNTSGSFAVAGTGTAGSGGTIANTSGADGASSGIGIRLENANGISLMRMQINDHPNFAIFGSNVNGFTLSNCVVNGTNGTSSALDEGSVVFNNLVGSASIASSNISGGLEDSFRLFSTSGVLDRLTVTGSTFTCTNSTVGQDAFAVNANSTATVKVTIQNSFFTSARAHLVEVLANDTSIVDLIFSGNALTNNNAGILSNAGGFLLAATHTTAVTYSINNNTMRDAVGTALVVDFGGTTASSSDGRIENNQIGVQAVANSGSAAAGCIGYFVDTGGGTHVVSINSNTARQYNNHGILIQAGDVMGNTSNMNVTVTNNTVGTPGTNTAATNDFNGLHLNHGVVSSDAFTSCLHIANNNVSGSGHGDSPPNNHDIRLRHRQSTTIRLPGYVGPASDPDTVVEQVITFLDTTNANDLATGTANGVSTGGGYIGGAACTTPSTPLALAEFALQAASRQKQSEEGQRVYRDILFAPEPASEVRDVTPISQKDLDIIVHAAIARWQSLGVDGEDLARLQAVTFEIADLPDDQLAIATPDKIMIDGDAAGYSWFIDSSPESNDEFQRDPAKQLRAGEASLAFNQIDLFTAVARGLNYVLEHGWWQRSVNGIALMQKTLPPSIRWMPVGPVERPIPLPDPIPETEQHQQQSKTIDRITPVAPQKTAMTTPASESSIVRIKRRTDDYSFFRIGAPSAYRSLVRYAAFTPMSGETVTRTIGDLPAGKTVTVTFRVTINDSSSIPPLPPTVCQVSNRGTVSGSNFSNVFTDDPDTGAPNDFTVTVLNNADLNLTKTDSPDPVITGSNITYTLNFSNTGPDAASNVNITDAVPANTTFVSASVTTGTGWATSAPSVGGTGNVTFTKGTVANAETAVFQIVVNVNAATANGTIITNTATAASDTRDCDSADNTTTTTTTAAKQADLAVTKADAPDPAFAGTNITYTINFTNNGPTNAPNTTITDAVPANTTFVSATVTTGTGWSTSAPAVGGTGNVVFSKADVANGETATFQIVVLVNASTAAGTIVTNTATAASDATDPTPANNTATATTTIQAQADLAVTKGDSPDPVFAGANITYTINFVNNGPGAAQTVTVTDAVPANTTFVSAAVTTGTGWSTTAPAVGGTGNVIFSKASVAASETAVFQIVVKVNSSTASGTTITNTATAASTTTDPDSANNTANATTTVNTQADLAVTKTDSPDPVIAGNDITYTINFVNNGPSDASTVTVTDAVPANTTFVSASVTTGTGWSTSAPAVGGTGNVVFSKASVPAGETAVFQIVVKVAASTANGTTITNTATAATTTTDPDSANNTANATTTVNTQADLAVTKADSPDPVTAGANITYTINFVNNGPSDAANVTVTDAVPANTTFVSASVTTGTGWSTSAPAVGGTGNVVFSKALVAATETAVFQIVVKVNSNTASGATITNDAVAASATTDPTPGNNTGTATTSVNAQADLAVTKSDSPDPVDAGANITYTINFVNNGPSDAGTVTVTDAVPANTTFVSATVTTGTGWATAAPGVGGTGNVIFSKTTVANGEVAVFQIVVQVGPTTPNGTIITNSAVAASTTTDPTPANNTGTATTTVQNQTDLAVTKSDSPDPVNAGANITYTINFVNNGPNSALNVTVTDAVPANATFVSAAVTSGTGWTITSPAVGGTGNVVFSKGTVLNGETATFQVVVNVDSDTASGATINNSAVAATTTTDTNPGNNTGTASTLVQTSADLAVTKSDSPDPVAAGNDITYTINFTNNGPSDAASVTVTDGVPTNTTFVSAVVTTGSGWGVSTPAVGGTGDIVFSKASVPAGETAVFTIVVEVNSSFGAGSVSNTVTAASSTTDPTPGNNTDTEGTTVQQQSDLEVTKSDSPDPVVAGTDLTYTINFINNGPSDATTVTVTDAVPANTTFVSAAVTTGSGWGVTQPPVGGTGNVVFSKGAVASGETAVFTIVVRVNANTPNGTTITNDAVAASTSTDPVPGNNTGTATTGVAAQADLAASKSDSPDPVVAGTNLTYTIGFVNNGPSVASTVTVTDAVPANTTFISAAVLTGTGWAIVAPGVGGTGNVVFSKAAAAPGETATFQLVVKVNSGAPVGSTITNNAVAASATTDPIPGNNTGTASTTVESQADLTVTKTALTGVATPGSNVTYRINVANNGPSDATNVTVTDAVPANTTFQSATVTVGAGWSVAAPPVGGTGNVVFSKPVMVVGETAEFNLVVKVNNNLGGASSITNTAVIASDTTDPVPGNSTSSVTTSAFDVCIFDPIKKKLLRFSRTTGDWEFLDCSKGGTKTTGKGKATTVGACKIDLLHPDPASPNKIGSVTIVAVANPCTGVGTAVVKIGTTVHTLLDPNVNDNTCSCP